MPSPARIGLAVAGGYLLGRTKKMRLALTLAGFMAGRRMTGPGGPVRRTVDQLSSSPEFEQLRGQLSGAGRDALLKVTASQLGKVTDRIEGASGSADGKPQATRRRASSGSGRGGRNG